MEQKQILLLAAAGLGVVYLMNKDKDQLQPNYGGGTAYNNPPPPPPQPNGTMDKINNTVQSGKTIIEAGKSIIDFVGGLFKKKIAPDFVPNMNASLTPPGMYA